MEKIYNVVQDYDGNITVKSFRNRDFAIDFLTHIVKENGFEDEVDYYETQTTYFQDTIRIFLFETTLI